MLEMRNTIAFLFNCHKIYQVIILAKKQIVIDPGHGGADGGASGNGIIEKNLTLEISKYMKNRFDELGIPAKLTRDTDIELSSNNRPVKALSLFGNGKDIILISNHINAGGGEGAEVIYSLRNNDILAKKILNEIEKSGQVVRKFYQRRLPSNTSKDYYYILRDTPNTEALIVEYGFLDTLSDANRLKANYKDYAEAVVRAVAEYGGYNYVPLNLSGYYVVKKGDTLWSISKAYGLSVDELKSLNNLTSNSLSIGQSLLVKDEGKEVTPDLEGYEYYIVKKGDTLYSIAKIYNTSVDKLKQINNLATSNLSIGQKLIVSETNFSNNYIVKSGDTLYGIAKRFNISVNELKNANNLNSDILSIGQSLIIPTSNIDQNNIEINTNKYTVVKNDTLYGIAKRFNTTVDEIKRLNNLNSNVLSVGKQLIIPS